MRIKTIIKCCTAILLFSHAFSAFASNRTPCPSASFARSNWQKLNTVERMNEKNWYTVKSDRYAIFDGENELMWEIGSITYATDFNTAFTAAQEQVKNVNMQINAYANETGGRPNYLTCHYISTETKRDIWLAAESHSHGNRLEQALATR